MDTQTATNRIIAVGLQCYKPTCGSNPGAPENVMNTAGDVFTQRPSVGHIVSHAKTTDNSGPTIHVNEDCAGGAVTAASLYDTHVFLDDTATQPGIVSGNSQLYGKIFARIQDPNCPRKGNDYFLRNEQWFFALHQFPLGAGKVDNPPMSGSLLTLVHTSIFPQPDDCKLEQEYFTREMGKVRHESYHNLDCGDPGGYYEQLHEILVANPGDCNPPSLEPPPQNWEEYGCGATIRSAPPIGSGNPDDDPQKAVDILTASNWTSVLFGVVTPSDNPTVDSISQPTIGYGDSNTLLTLRGSFPVNKWFANNVTVSLAGNGIDTVSELGLVSQRNTTVDFKIPQKDWNDRALQCGDTAYVRVFDGVSTSNVVPLTITCP